MLHTVWHCPPVCSCSHPGTYRLFPAQPDKHPAALLPARQPSPSLLLCAGQTTHRADFMQREVVAPAKAIVRGCNIPTSAGPFNGQSLYAQSFS